jgi:hypothetical protein
MSRFGTKTVKWLFVDLSGISNGKIYLSGFPQYNDKSKEIYFDELDYVLDTKNKLMRTGSLKVSSSEN